MHNVVVVKLFSTYAFLSLNTLRTISYSSTFDLNTTLRFCSRRHEWIVASSLQRIGVGSTRSSSRKIINK